MEIVEIMFWVCFVEDETDENLLIRICVWRVDLGVLVWIWCNEKFREFMGNFLSEIEDFGLALSEFF